VPSHRDPELSENQARRASALKSALGPLTDLLDDPRVVEVMLVSLPTPSPEGLMDVLVAAILACRLHPDDALVPATLALISRFAGACTAGTPQAGAVCVRAQPAPTEVRR
jgi:Flp pilus assembly CpaF family ATPase